MGLDIIFADDIRNALLAADEASAATAAVAYLAVSGETAELKGFRRGYRAALATVALAFGLSPINMEITECQNAPTVETLTLSHPTNSAQAAAPTGATATGKVGSRRGP